MPSLKKMENLKLILLIFKIYAVKIKNSIFTYQLTFDKIKILEKKLSQNALDLRTRLLKYLLENEKIRYNFTKTNCN